MAKRTITADDLTGREIEGPEVSASITLSLTVGDVTTEFKAEGWDLAMNTAESLQALVESADLAAFMIRMRPTVSLQSTDSQVIRDWAKANHPEFKVGDHGRIPADVIAAYRREVANKVNAPDGPANSGDSVASDK